MTRKLRRDIQRGRNLVTPAASTTFCNVYRLFNKGKTTMTIQEILDAQQRACEASRKGRPHSAPAPVDNSVAAIIARQKAAVDAQKAAREAKAMASGLSGFDMEQLKKEYQEFLAKLSNDETMFFTPNVPPGTEVKFADAGTNPAMNGISVGSEMGDTATIVMSQQPAEPEPAEPVDEPVALDDDIPADVDEMPVTEEPEIQVSADEE